MSGPAYATGQILISKNEDWQVTLQYRNLALATTDLPEGVPIDISTSTFRFQIRSTEAQRTALLEAASPDGVIINDGENGIFTIQIWHAEANKSPNSAILPVGVFVADLIRILSDGRIERLWEGTATVNEGVTR